MDTSREDVGIAIRSAFLAKGTKQRFSLFVLVILSVLFIFVETIETKPRNYLRSFIKDTIYRGAQIVSLPTKGFGKRSSAYEYRISNRGGKGITGIKTTLKNGKVIDSFIISNEDQLILVSDQGQIIRVSVNQIRIAGRSTQGVSIFKIPEGDKIVYVSRVGDLESK